MDATSVFLRKLRTVCEYAGILSPKPCRPFRFLDLPTEIRLLIYQELFGGSTAHRVLEWVQRVPPHAQACEPLRQEEERVHGLLFHFDHDNTSCRFQSALLRSCKTVYNEALPVLYANPVFDISMYAGREGNLPLVNAAYIRRVTTDAFGQETLNEGEIAEGYRSAGIQWDKLLLFAIDMGRGLGTGVAKDASAAAIERALCGRTAPITYDASDVEWLWKTSSASELKRFGICFMLVPRSWYIRKGSTVLRDEMPETSTNYIAHGSSSHVLRYQWESS